MSDIDVCGAMHELLTPDAKPSSVDWSSGLGGRASKHIFGLHVRACSTRTADFLFRSTRSLVLLVLFNPEVVGISLLGVACGGSHRDLVALSSPDS